MLDDYIVPAIVNPNIEPNINLYDRTNIAHFMINTFTDYIKSDLGLMNERISIHYMYSDGRISEDHNIDTPALAVTFEEDDGSHTILIFINVIMRVTVAYTAYQLCKYIVTILAHEFRHIYQSTHKIYDFMILTDKEYVTNHDEVDYEKDAIDYELKFVNMNLLQIRSAAIQCISQYRTIDYSMCSQFDIYNFLNQYRIESPTMYSQICKTFLGFDGDVIFLPVYNKPLYIDTEEDYDNNILHVWFDNTLFYNHILHDRSVQNIANVILMEIFYTFGNTIKLSRNKDFQITKLDPDSICEILIIIQMELHMYMITNVY